MYPRNRFTKSPTSVILISGLGHNNLILLHNFSGEGNSEVTSRRDMRASGSDLSVVIQSLWGTLCELFCSIVSALTYRSPLVINQLFRNQSSQESFQLCHFCLCSRFFNSKSSKWVALMCCGLELRRLSRVIGIQFSGITSNRVRGDASLLEMSPKDK
jgi:hypothetical protein